MHVGRSRNRRPFSDLERSIGRAITELGVSSRNTIASHKYLRVIACAVGPGTPFALLGSVPTVREGGHRALEEIDPMEAICARG